MYLLPNYIIPWNQLDKKPVLKSYGEAIIITQISIVKKKKIQLIGVPELPIQYAVWYDDKREWNYYYYSDPDVIP